MLASLSVLASLTITLFLVCEDLWRCSLNSISSPYISAILEGRREGEGGRGTKECIVSCLGQINNQSIVFVVASLKPGSEYLAL